MESFFEPREAFLRLEDLVQLQKGRDHLRRRKMPTKDRDGLVECLNVRAMNNHVSMPKREPSQGGRMARGHHVETAGEGSAGYSYRTK